MDEETLFNRLVGRGREDDEPDVIRQRFRTYRQLTEPLLDYYRRRGMLETVEGSGDQQQVFGRIEKAVAQFRQRRSTGESADG